MFTQKRLISLRKFFVLYIIMICVVLMGFSVLIISSFWGDNVKRENNEKYIASQPIITKNARVITKRLYVGGNRNRTHTSYYVTFELSDGKRVEYLVTPEEYGLLVEGDKGKLSTQLTEYRGFKRQISP